MRRFRSFPRITLVAFVATFAVALASCGGSDGPSVRAGTDTSATSSPATSTTSAVGPTTTTSVPPSTLAGDSQLVSFHGISFVVPKAWPVRNLATDPTQCVRADVHAVYLGQQGPNAKCPAGLVGRTESIQIEQLDGATQLDAAQATQTAVVNGLAVKVDPDPDRNGALTVLFPDKQLVAIITYGVNRAVADQILASVAAA
jgi:hypothetical protein